MRGRYMRTRVQMVTRSIGRSQFSTDYLGEMLAFEQSVNDAIECLEMDGHIDVVDIKYAVVDGDISYTFTTMIVYRVKEISRYSRMIKEADDD